MNKTTILLPKEILEKAKEFAKKKGLSLASYIRMLLINDMEENK